MGASEASTSHTGKVGQMGASEASTSRTGEVGHS
jgi:hypothetical protein